jgi:hypothetical protein
VKVFAEIACPILVAAVVALFLAPRLSERFARRSKTVGDTWPSRAAQDAPVNTPTAPKVDWAALSRMMRRTGRGVR